MKRSGRWKTTGTDSGPKSREAVNANSNGSTRRRIWRNVAAAAAVVLLAAGTNYVVVKDYLRTKIETNIVTSAHDKGEYVLPDGTHIWLNAGSVLRYYGDLTGRRRVVELEAKASSRSGTMPTVRSSCRWRI